MSGKKTIDYRFKILYALAIIMVVWSHIDTNQQSPLRLWLPYNSIQLAIFAFSSGYFFKLAAVDKLGAYTAKKFRNLIIPMYLYNFAYAAVVLASQFLGFHIGGYVTAEALWLSPLYNGHQFYYNLGSWFVVPLFLIETGYAAYRSLVRATHQRSPEWVHFALFFALGMLGNALAGAGFNTGWWLLLCRTLYFVPFYAFGVWYRASLEERDQLPAWAYLLFVPVFFVILHQIFGFVPDYNPVWCNNFVNGPLLPFILGLAGIFFFFKLASLLEPHIGRARLVNLIADHTYSIMVNQFLGLLLVKAIFGQIYLHTHLFPDFNWQAYHTDIWYYYLPGGHSAWMLLYFCAGVSVPILIQWLLDRATRFIFRPIIPHPKFHRQNRQSVV